MDSPALVDRFLGPFYRFAKTSASGGIVLLAATAIALVWANSPWADAYHALWETPVVVGGPVGLFRTDLHHLINDGLMAVFFFVVGLEIKREILAGELSDVRSATLPMVAALGGMIVPALLYASFTLGDEAIRGWGVPMATDIAFALGALALLGDRIPNGLRVFLAALAIVDDLGAILVIALFYSGDVDWTGIAGAAAVLALAAVANLAGVRRAGAYAVIGVALWLLVAASGIHATIAGVLLAMTIPVRTRMNEGAFVVGAERALADFRRAAQQTADDPDTTALTNASHHAAIRELEDLCEGAQPPLIRIEHGLHGIVAFAIMPLFALANAGVSLAADSIGGALASPVTLAVAIGLVLGKPLGIVGFSWLAVRSGLGALPSGVDWRLLSGAGVLGGIGFTMALFIAGLAFGEGALLESAKLGVIAASAVAGVVGWLILSRAPARPS